MNDLEWQRWKNLGKRFTEEEKRITDEKREKRARRIWENVNPSIPKTFIVRIEE